MDFGLELVDDKKEIRDMYIYILTFTAVIINKLDSRIGFGYIHV